MARDVAAVQKRKKQDTSELKAAADVKDFSEKKNDDAPALTMKKKPVLLLALSCLAPYVYMLLTVDLKEGIRRSIFVNLVMSIGGFFLTIMLIPVASRYLLRKNMFGYDINKKGSEAGTLKV